MNREKRIFVTCDLLKPSETSQNPQLACNHSSLERLTEILKSLGIEADIIWKSVWADLETWLSQEHTSEILEPYLQASPDFLQSAYCVVGWELPTGLRKVLETEKILWISFAQYIWSPRNDILIVTSNDPSLLAAIHQPLPRFQPTWTFDDQLRESCFLVIDPPYLHSSRVHNGKLHCLNDCVDQISELMSTEKDILLFPGTAIQDSRCFFAFFVGFRALQGAIHTTAVYVSSPRVRGIASVDPSVAPLAEIFQKPFQNWSHSSQPFALISYRSLKSRRLWDEVLNRAQPVK